ncbi:MAG: hypothetical protein HOY78_17190 [Saccharothrix sp.]|nr:hypothetical protein [Saccharothrix sp.]
MSADFFETGAEGGGLADWLDGYEPGTGLGAAFGAAGPAPAVDPGSGREPAYPARFGWMPPLIPLPRRAPDELF